MTNFEYLKLFQEFPFDYSYINFPQCRISYIPTNKSVFENYGLINTNISGKEIEEMEHAFAKIDRTPTFYFEDREDFDPIRSLLSTHAYNNSWHDSWLFYNNKITYDTLFEDILTVQNTSELNIFVDTFDECYQENDPQNPYGTVKDTLNLTRSRWIEQPSQRHTEYFVAYDGKDPVATAALTSYKGLGYISAVGSLQKVRGQGFGKKISLFAVYISQQLGNQHTFLLTEAGTYPYEFYKRIGFVEKFTAIGMSKLP